MNPILDFPGWAQNLSRGNGCGRCKTAVRASCRRLVIKQLVIFIVPFMGRPASLNSRLISRERKSRITCYWLVVKLHYLLDKVQEETGMRVTTAGREVRPIVQNSIYYMS